MTTIALLRFLKGIIKRHLKMIIILFLIGHDRVDHHVMQFLPDHPKYDVVEMMIAERTAKR